MNRIVAFSQRLPNVSHIVTAASIVVLAFLFVPLTAKADFEIVPGLAADHAGAYVIEDVSFNQSETSVVIGDDLTEATADWDVHILLPFFDDEVPEERAAFMLGKFEEDDSVDDELYTIVHTQIPETGEAQASFPELILKDPSNPSGTYTLQVYVYPETKTVENTDPICYDWDYWDSVDYEGYDETCFPEEPYTEQDFLDWFQWNVLINEDEYEGEIPKTYEPESFRQLNFDYTAVTYVEPSEPDPVIIIPGILGSWEKNGELVIDPVLHTYDDLINTFVLNGFEEGETIFSFPYEWRDTNIFTAGLLRDKINEVQSVCECDKVDIVAHSMGGLVARYYIQSGLYEDDVDQLIFIATPHLGSPKAYLAWEGGEFGFQLRDNILEYILKQEGRKNGFDNLFDYIQNRPVISVQQLLPTFDYLREADIGLRPYPVGYPQNTFLENLNDNVANLLNSGVDIANFIGNTGVTSTISTLRLVDSPNLPKWSHGYPEFFNNPLTDRGLEYGSGDDTVALPSASFIDSDITELNAGHDAVVKASQALVYETLVGEAPTQISDLQQNADYFLLLQVLSPVDVQIIAPDGKRLGKDFETGNELNEVLGAFYSGFDTDNEYAVIPNPIDGEYKILSQGTNNGGKYTLVSGYASAIGLVEQETTSHILPGDTEEVTLTIDNESPEELTMEDTTVVTYEVLFNHIDEIAGLGWITNNKFKKVLERTAKKAEKLSDRGRSFAEKALLHVLLVELRIGLKKGKVNDDGYNLLREDIDALLGR